MDGAIYPQRRLMDFVLGASAQPCPGCGGYPPDPGHGYCLGCSVELRVTDRVDSLVLERELAWRMPVVHAHALWWAEAGSRAEALYKALKFGGRRTLGPALGLAMARHRERMAPWPDGLVPVPTTLQRTWSRGYNQAHLLAEGMAAHAALPVYPHLLQRLEGGLNLARLDRKQRIVQAQRDFAHARTLDNSRFAEPCLDLKGMHLLLVDDVMTSGATLEQCGALLIQRGARLSVMVLARRRNSI
ncbi:MAG: ComF family protein [Bacteroidia bacterium]|jgi:ComF family protein